MHTIEEHVDVAVPAADAYAQVTQFEAMPEFLRHVESVEQVDERRLRLQLGDTAQPARIAAEITEQIPDKRIAWTSTSGPRCSGCLTFHRLDDGHSRVMVQLGLEAQAGEGAADVTGNVRLLLLEALEDFRHFLEGRGEATGRWSGRIPAPDERGGEKQQSDERAEGGGEGL